MEEEIRLLYDFVLDNAELESLEDILSEFNVFDVLGVVSRELKHSNMLAWLLNPNGTHTLGEYFLKKFLKFASSKGHQLGINSVSPIEVDVWDYGEMNILREWKNIDITLEDFNNSFVCIIENKVFASERKNQLSDYRKLLQQHYGPEIKKAYIFLTPDGVDPSERGEEIYYIPLSYGEVNSMIEHVLRAKENSLSEEIRTFLMHYSNVLRRYIMSESELEKLAVQIYKKHKKALDIIFEHKPDLQSDIYEHLEQLVKSYSDLLVPDHSVKSFIRFSVHAFDQFDDLKKGNSWTKSEKILLFEFKNVQESLSLNLIIGPGDQAVREKIHQHIKQNKQLFSKGHNVLTKQWRMIYSKEILRKKDYEAADMEMIKSKIESALKEFVEGDLLKIIKEIDAIGLS